MQNLHAHTNILATSCFLGAFPPVEFRAVVLVRAILQTKW